MRDRSVKLFNSGFYNSTNLKNSQQVNIYNQNELKGKASLYSCARVFDSEASLGQNHLLMCSFAANIDT